MRPVIESVQRDLRALHQAGVDGLLFCNEADLPYQLGVGPEAAAAMAAVIGEVRGQIRLPFGVDLVWDPVASLAVARATGSCFVREVVTGAYESDLGIMKPDFGAIAAYRTNIGAESVALLANVTPEFASPLARRSVAERTRGAIYLGVDGVLISGPITGTPTDIGDLRAARAAAGQTPVLANTGVTTGTVADILAVADGAIVGTHLKHGGITWNPVDPRRAEAFMRAARQAREEVAVG
jgi:uncharacterized protein